MTEQENISPKEIKPVKKNISEDKWYALYTRPRAEKLVFQRLVEEGIETFLPLQKTYRMWSDRKKLVEKPLLSSYIFVKTIKKNFPRVYKTTGVVKFVSFEKCAQGDNVEVINGSLIGLTGELIKIGSKNRVVVRIDRLDQNLILKIPLGFLKKV